MIITVLKVINSLTIFKDITSTDFLREIQTMAKLNTPFVVQYNQSWIENNTLFIQMEYCFDNLKNILTIKPKVFERSENQAMNSIEYYISLWNIPSNNRSSQLFAFIETRTTHP